MNNTSQSQFKQTGGVRYLVAEPFGLTFLGLDGNLHTIYGCPLPKLRELAGLMEILWNEVNGYLAKDANVTIPEIFHDNRLFQQLCLRVLELCQIPAASVDINMMSELLFPFLYDGQIVDGMIMALNFPKESSPSIAAAKRRNTTKADVKTSWDDLLASLWISTKNLQVAVEVSNEIPWNQLAPTMVSRNEAFAPPEEKENQEILKQYAEVVASKKVNLDIEFDPDNLGMPGFSEPDAGIFGG
jgi:hypothetical protein